MRIWNGDFGRPEPQDSAEGKPKILRVMIQSCLAVSCGLINRQTWPSACHAHSLTHTHTHALIGRDRSSFRWPHTTLTHSYAEFPQACGFNLGSSLATKLRNVHRPLSLSQLNTACDRSPTEALRRPCPSSIALRAAAAPF